MFGKGTEIMTREKTAEMEAPNYVTETTVKLVGKELRLLDDVRKQNCYPTIPTRRSVVIEALQILHEHNKTRPTA